MRRVLPTTVSCWPCRRHITFFIQILQENLAILSQSMLLRCFKGSYIVTRCFYHATNMSPKAKTISFYDFFSDLSKPPHPRTTEDNHIKNCRHKKCIPRVYALFPPWEYFSSNHYHVGLKRFSMFYWQYTTQEWRQDAHLVTILPPSCHRCKIQYISYLNKNVTRWQERLHIFSFASIWVVNIYCKD